jgi:hypothetical protein
MDELDADPDRKQTRVILTLLKMSKFAQFSSLDFLKA